MHKFSPWVLAIAAVGAAACTTAPTPAVSPASPAQSQEAQSGAALERAGARIVQMINGHGDPSQIFTPAFLSRMPAARLNALAASVRDRLGNATAVTRVESTALYSGTFFVGFEGREVPVSVSLQPTQPHLIDNLEF